MSIYQGVALTVGYIAIVCWCMIALTMLIEALRNAHRSRVAQRTPDEVKWAIERVIRESQRV
jgi:hypothetical protein